MNLLEQIEHEWAKGAGKIAAGWAVKLKKAKDSLGPARQKFYQWYPLIIYTSYSNAIDRRCPFSVRYLGQEVAMLRVKSDGVYICISKEHAVANRRFGMTLLPREYPWRNVEAKEFRRHFRSLEHREYHSSVNEEHRIESEILQHMKNRTGSKFNGTLRGIQPVTLGGLPFQLPVPISGHTGIPQLRKNSHGNIDILARRGTGRGTRISVWELKRPDEEAQAIKQAYIYSVTLLKMLRMPQSGEIWYNDIIGFRGKIPCKLAMECVVALSFASAKTREKFEEKMQSFKDQNALRIGNDTISLHIAHYQKEPLTVELKNF